MEKEHLYERLWEQGLVLIEDGCLIRDEDGEPCGREPVIGVWVDSDGDPVLDNTVEESRPVIFCARHYEYPAVYEVRGLSSAVDWHGRKCATLLDGPPSPPRINPIPDPF